ncbi:MAG: hypothetical protein OHK0012_05820 [Synechococcales cyanobacterium]
MAVQTEEWSSTEQDIAQRAFHMAYEREITALMAEVRRRVDHVTQIEEIWRLHDFLSARRHQMDGKYDFNFPALLFIFAGLVKEGWLGLEDLQGLAGDKLAKISALTRM